MHDDNQISPPNWPENSPATDAVSLAQQQEWHDQFAQSDKIAGIETTADFRPFKQKNDLFTRAFWDKRIQSKKTDEFFSGHRVAANPRKADGFKQRDMALRNASWSVSNMISSRKMDVGKREGFQALIEEGGPVSPVKADIPDLETHTSETKRIAKLFGADLVKITGIDSRWHYASRVDARDFCEAPNELPDTMTNVIVMGHAMDFDLVSTYPSALASAAAGLEYSHETGIVIQLVTYIRNLGYNAVGSMNDTALVIPYAIKAGLGEYGRNQMVITPEFGPRARFSKVFTDMPLAHDVPQQSGVRAFCDICTKCADACPPKALPYGPPTADVPNQSTISGVKKWSADCEKCFGYWAAIGSDCAICMRVCPFNRAKNGWKDRIWRRLALGRWRKLALKWDNRSARANRVKPKDWWQDK